METGVRASQDINALCRRHKNQGGPVEIWQSGHGEVHFLLPKIKNVVTLSVMVRIEEVTK